MKNLKKLFIGAGVLAAMLVVQGAQASIDVDAVNNTLKQRNAQWTAKRSWVTNLTETQQKRLLGVNSMKTPAAANFRGIDKTRFMSSSDVMDWRNYNGQNWVGPVMDQGNCGSCVAFSTVATLEVQMNVSQNLPWLDRQFSPQDLFECGGATFPNSTGPASCNTGWEPDLAANYLVQTGIPSEALAPYTSGATGQDPTCTNTCANNPSACQKIESVSTPSSYGVNFDAVKAALQKGPLETTLYVYADFMTYGSGVYKHTTGNFLGGHAVSIVGYDDTKRAWIIRNSWGPTWGINGFAYVSYDDQSGVADNTWAYTISSDAGEVALTNLRDRDFISGQHGFAVKSTYTSTKSLTVALASTTDKTAAVTADCSSGGCSVDTTKLSDGEYTVVVNGTLADGSTVSSEPKYIFILNTPSQLSLKTQLDPAGDPDNDPKQNCQDKDITKPMSCRIVFDIDATTNSAVPFSSVRFIAKDSSGNVITDRSANTVMPGLTMGWRTNLYPNGTYEVYFIGYQNTDAGQNSVESPHYKIVTQN